MTINPPDEAKLQFMRHLLGPVIQAALDDDNIIEIKVTPKGVIGLKPLRGVQQIAGELGEYQALNFITQLAQLRGIVVNHNYPEFDAVLPFRNERINVISPPIAARACFVIRKPARCIYTLEDYCNSGILSQVQRDAIEDGLRARKNILVSGAPMSGKTTLANAIVHRLDTLADPNETIVLMEDTPELQCRLPFLFDFLTTREGVSMQQLLKKAMRTSPDRILVGEVRDAAALDLLKSWNTGCPGGLATIHANSARASVLRLLSLAQEAHVPPPYELIAETIQYLVHVGRDETHPAGRRVTEVVELTGFRDGEFYYQTLA